MRKFEVVQKKFLKYGQNAKDVVIPIRKTMHSVGYDFHSPIDIVIPPNSAELIWTNIKAQFNNDEALILAVTSGMGKNNVILANAIGVIECDYFSNESNDGNLGFRLYNFGKEDYVVKKNDKIGQGMFFKFLTVDNETPPTEIRKGGFGSTNK